MGGEEGGKKNYFRILIYVLNPRNNLYRLRENVFQLSIVEPLDTNEKFPKWDVVGRCEV